MESKTWRPRVVAVSKRFVEKAKIEKDHALISIRGQGEKFPYLRKSKHRVYLLKLFFDDVEEGGNGYPPSLKDVDNIITFIEKCRGKIPLIVCQCYAGISRSAAVAIGICDYLGLSSEEFFKSPRYYPNKLILKLFSQYNKLRGV